MISRVLLVFLVLSSVYSQTYIIPDLQRDDFLTKKSWWIFQHHGNQTDATIQNGYLHASLVDPLNGNPGGRMDASLDGMENVGFMTAEQRPIYNKNTVVQASIRVKTLNDLPVGSRGWGFWKSERLAKINQAVWFMQQTADPDSAWAAQETWWRARSTNGVEHGNQISTDLDSPPLSIDNQQWHTYTVIRNGRDYYRHYVDGQLIQEVVPSDFASGKILNEDYSFNCWNDNVVYHQKTSPDTIEEFTNGWLGTSEFIVDFVEIIRDNISTGYSVSPQGIVSLREVINKIDDGVQNGLWQGPFNFNASGGPCVILATARAEQYGLYDDDDDLKMVLDSKDFGYNTSRSWDGNSDDGSARTVLIDTSLSSGQHTLEFHSEVTPLLYDATVLSSANGQVALDVTLDETAPAGSSNLLWKNYSFSCEAGQVAVYISGTADEEPGWNHQDASIDSSDDDELRVVLDNTDYGWGTENSFVGNTLFGGPKAVLITQDVPAGLHELKLYVNESPTVYRVVVFVENKEGTSAISEEPQVVNRFELRQNFPNPFNPATRIEFHLNQKDQTQIDIFNIQGQWIKTLIHQPLSPGSHVVTWNGTDSRQRPVPSGVYLYRLRAGANVAYKKMTLLR